jgi:hypothetical protein
MADKTFGVWDVVSNATFGEGQIVEIKGDKADVHFRDGRRVILQAALSFVRSGKPKEFLPSRKKLTGESGKHLPKDEPQK